MNSRPLTILLLFVLTGCSRFTGDKGAINLETKEAVIEWLDGSTFQSVDTDWETFDGWASFDEGGRPLTIKFTESSAIYQSCTPSDYRVERMQGGDNVTNHPHYFKVTFNIPCTDDEMYMFIMPNGDVSVKGMIFDTKILHQNPNKAVNALVKQRKVVAGPVMRKLNAEGKQEANLAGEQKANSEGGNSHDAHNSDTEKAHTSIKCIDPAGREYRTVKIGDQIWMAENLAYNPPTGNYWAYDNDPKNVAKYGYLYDWETANKVCPAGWHLPSDDEWTRLTDYLGGEKVAGSKMKSRTGWSNNGNGTDESGFSGLPGGFGFYDGTFGKIGGLGYWWSSSEYGASSAWARGLHYDDGSAGRGNYSKTYGFYDDGSAGRGNYSKTYGFSVRCLRD